MQQPPDIPLRSYQQKHHTPFISTPTPTPFYINKKTLPIISLFDCSSIKTYLYPYFINKYLHLKLLCI